MKITLEFDPTPGYRWSDIEKITVKSTLNGHDFGAIVCRSQSIPIEDSLIQALYATLRTAKLEFTGSLRDKNE